MKKEKTYKKPGKGTRPKQKNPVKRISTGRNKPLLVALWVLFALAFGWSIYKNFTAVDTHTVHEVEVIRAEIVDTSDVEAFAGGFVRAFHTHSSSERDSTRRETLEAFMTDSLALLNAKVETATGTEIDMTVTGFDIWALEDIGSGNYKVTYSITQLVHSIVTEMQPEYVEEVQLTETTDPETGEVVYEDAVVQKELQNPVEVESTKVVQSSFYVVIHRDGEGNLVIIQNPTITGIPQRSASNYAVPATSSTVNANTVREIDDFLEKFFVLYPQADDAQLAYYVKNEALGPIYQDYAFVALASTAYTKDGDTITAYVTVKYQDNHTGVIQLSQYVLQVQQDGNWFIVGNASV